MIPKCVLCCFIVVVAMCCYSVIADDKEEVQTLSDHIISAFKDIAPIYADLRDDYATKDYDRRAVNAQRLKRVLDDALEDIGYDDRVDYDYYAVNLDKKEKMVFAAYKGYLIGMLNSANIALESGKYVEGGSSFEHLAKACEEYGVECGLSLPEARELKKPLW